MHARRDGVSLYYEQAGRGAPPFVFVHGWCCDHTFFHPQVEHFEKAHAVTTLDLRGCGKSDVPDTGYDIPSLADDVAWLCREARIERPVIVGHSLGGMIGIEIGARHPALPSAVVAIDPAPIDPLPEARRMFEAFVAQLEGPHADATRRAYVKDLFEPGDDSERARAIADTMCAVPSRVAAAVIRGVIEWNGVDALLRCRAPVLVLLSRMGGSNDPARVLQVRPDVWIGVTVGSGHFNQLDAAEQVTPMIEKFVRVAAR